MRFPSVKCTQMSTSLVGQSVAFGVETFEGDVSVGKWAVFLLPESPPRPCSPRGEGGAPAWASPDVLVVP